jgi:hypothetical protein
MLLDLGIFFFKCLNKKMVTARKFALDIFLIVIINESLDTQCDMEAEQTLLYATCIMSSLCPQLPNMATERNFIAIADKFDVYTFYT